MTEGADAPMTMPKMASDPATDAALYRLGARLAALRRSAGYSQTELGRKVGYSRGAVGDSEHGRANVGAAFWAACDSALGANRELISEYERISERKKEIRVTRAASRAAERAAARQARTATRSTIAAILAAATGPGPVPTIAAIVIVWNDGTTTTATTTTPPPGRSGT